MTSIFHSVKSISEVNEPIINFSYPEYLYYGQFERTDDIDKRIYERILSTDIQLRPNFDPRPLNTRHQVFPNISKEEPEQKKRASVPIRKYLEYDTIKTFSPIQSKAPIEGYLHHVNTESSLRNQFFGLQHGAIQSTYIPSSRSDLYHAQVPIVSNKVEQPFPLLFKKCEYHTSGNQHIYNSSIGKEIFNNATKQQLRGL
jgi:hypothetical protein